MLGKGFDMFQNIGTKGVSSIVVFYFIMYKREMSFQIYTTLILIYIQTNCRMNLQTTQLTESKLNL